jgi:hypothetical protein
MSIYIHKHHNVSILLILQVIWQLKITPVSATYAAVRLNSVQYTYILLALLLKVNSVAASADSETFTNSDIDFGSARLIYRNYRWPFLTEHAIIILCLKGERCLKSQR